jgi:hypothetical protein
MPDAPSPPPDDDDPDGPTRAVAAPLVVFFVTATIGVAVGSALANSLRGWLDWSGLGWWAAGGLFGPFLAIYFWLDFLRVRARAGKPFSTSLEAQRLNLRLLVQGAGLTVAVLVGGLPLVALVASAQSDLLQDLVFGGWLVLFSLALLSGAVLSLRARLGLVLETRE